MDQRLCYSSVIDGEPGVESNESWVYSETEVHPSTTSGGGFAVGNALPLCYAERRNGHGGGNQHV